jgi:hypothetical protein
MWYEHQGTPQLWETSVASAEYYVAFFWNGILSLTQISSICNNILSELAVLAITSTHLLSECQYWKYYENISRFETLSCSPQSYTTTTQAETAKPQVDVRSKHYRLIQQTYTILYKNTWNDERPPTGIIWDEGHIRGMGVSEWWWGVNDLVSIIEIPPSSTCIAKGWHHIIRSRLNILDWV